MYRQLIRYWSIYY